MVQFTKKIHLLEVLVIFETSTLYGLLSDVFDDTNINTVTVADIPDLSDDIHEPTNSINTNGNKDMRNNTNKSPLIRNCGSLNVCGIKRKMSYPELCELICKYDLFCITETKIDSHDNITLSGYKFLAQSHKQKHVRKSGRIGLFVKNLISPHISLVESDSDYIMWFRLC